MRLIDADAFIEYLGLDAENAREENTGEIVTLEDFDRQPTAFDKEKVKQELEISSKLYSLNDRDCEFAIPQNIALEIIEKGGIE